jgi:hypothetical protein
VRPSGSTSPISDRMSVSIIQTIPADEHRLFVE